MRKFFVFGLFLLCSMLPMNAAKVPDVVFDTSITGITSANVTFSLFTPTKTGVYRVTIYEDFPGSNGGASSFVNFTSVNGSASNFQSCVNGNSIDSCSSVTSVRALANTAITLQMISGNSSPLYDLYVVVEQIQ